MNLRQIREDCGISQKEFAKMLNVSPTNIYNYESGRTQPSIEWLIKIADALKISVDYLLGREDDLGNIKISQSTDRENEVSQLTEKEKQLLNAFKAMNEDAQDKLIDDALFYAKLNKKVRV